MAGIRKDIATLGTWSDELIWYALAVGELRTRELDVRTSWTYLAAIHGINAQGWFDQGIIPLGTPAPSQDEMRLMWDQCQHAGWFFLPWHRGYLAAFESILADWIRGEGGSNDWALPYWNYLDDTKPAARDLPQEFLDATLPAHAPVGAGDPNPLANANRGPATVLGPQPWIPVDISLDVQTSQEVYTSEPGTLGYGGPISGFDQQGNAFGAVESDPHNFVHVMVGGDTSPSPTGWMFDPAFAALDPIFWVHHCNIDRLWAAWMTVQENEQESTQPWRNGPFPRQFTMPTPGATLEVFMPGETLAGERLEPQYDSLTSGTGITPPAPAPELLAAEPPSPDLAAMTNPPLSRRGVSALSGANDRALTVEDAPVRSEIALRQEPAELASADLAQERVFLNVEGVRGNAASGVLTVVIIAPGEDAQEGAEETLVFFGLQKATITDGAHAGNGLSATVDVTAQVRALQEASGEPLEKLEVILSQPTGASGEAITVDRVSLYRRRGG